MSTALLFQYLRSLTCVHASPSSLMACSHWPLSLSSETPRTVKFFALNSLNAITTLGFSCLQGIHQLAQKSTNKYFPRKDDIFLICPFASGKARSGAILPTHKLAFASYSF